MRIPRTTGFVSGLAIVVLAVWAGLVPFVGPSFHYAFGSYQTWHVTSSRVWLDIVPAVAALVAGVLLIASRHRTSGIFAGALGIAAGTWLIVGPSVSALWGHGGIGAPLGSHHRQALEQLGYFYGPGTLIAALSAFALGRFVSRPRVAGEAAAVTADAAAVARGPRRRRFLRRERSAEPAQT